MGEIVSLFYKYTVTTFFIFVLFFQGCGNTEEKEVSGYHFQGRDCLSCHNNDLQPAWHQSLAGSVFISQQASIDELSSYCKGKLFVLISIDGSFDATSTIDSRQFVSLDSAGFNAIGNLFLLQRDQNITGSTGFIRIVNENNVTIAQSLTPHAFTQEFNSSNPVSATSRHSCNACHGSVAKGGAPGFIYPNIANVSVCQ